MLDALLAAGARPDAQVTEATRVTRNGQVLMIGEHLLGATPFALAAKFAEADMMRALLVAGADGVLPLRNGLDPADAGGRRELALRRLGPSRADAAPGLRLPGGARR